jgi:hypothetical protein
VAPTLRRHLSTAGVLQVETGDPADLRDLPRGHDLTTLALLTLPTSPRRAAELLGEVTSGVGVTSNGTAVPGVLLELRREPAPVAYREVFETARRLGLRRIARVGPLASAGLVWEALDVLHAERLDHAGCVLDDADLVARLRHDGTGVSLCLTHEEPRVPVMLDEGLSVHVEDCCDPAADTDALLARVARSGLSSSATEALRRNAVRSSTTFRSSPCAAPPSPPAVGSSSSSNPATRS